MYKKRGCKILGLLFGAILFAQPARATSITFTVPPPSVGVVFQGPPVDLFSSGLNGTALSGQPLSLDLVLNDALLARLFLLNPSQLGIGLTIYTNAGTFPGLAGTTTGLLLDANNNPFGQSQTAGRSQGSDGTFDLGLVSFTSANLGGANVVDIRGAHFDTTFPNTGFVVNNARLRFSLNSNSVEFGTAQQLPETSTAILLLVGMSFFSFFIRRRVTAKTET